MSAMYHQILTELPFVDREPFWICFDRSINARERARCLVWSFDRRISHWNPFLYEKKAIWPGGKMLKKRKKRELQLQNRHLNPLANTLLEFVHLLKGKQGKEKRNTMEKFSRFQAIQKMKDNSKPQNGNSSVSFLSPKLFSIATQTNKQNILSPDLLSLNENAAGALKFLLYF
jgi:hypothetical protein